MAQLTIQIPDELATRLEPILHRLPDILSQLVDINTLSSSTEILSLNDSGTIPPVYTEILDFFIKSPTPKEIAAFKVANQTQKRLQILLEKNSLGTITPAENSELDVYEQLDQLMTLLKARAYQVIS